MATAIGVEAGAEIKETKYIPLVETADQSPPCTILVNQPAGRTIAATLEQVELEAWTQVTGRISAAIRALETGTLPHDTIICQLRKVLATAAQTTSQTRALNHFLREGELPVDPRFSNPDETVLIVDLRRSDLLPENSLSH